MDMASIFQSLHFPGSWPTKLQNQTASGSLKRLGVGLLELLARNKPGMSDGNIDTTIIVVQIEVMTLNNLKQGNVQTILFEVLVKLVKLKDEKYS